jgi:hypothetical protein
MILALDLGASTGWATYEPAVPIFYNSGTWDLREAGEDIAERCRMLRDRIIRAGFGHAGTLAYEQVRHIGGGPIAAHHYGALRATAREARLAIGWNVAEVNTSAVKRAAGLGAAADKRAMLAAAAERWPEAGPWTRARHDEADARFCALAAAEIIARVSR